MKIDSQLEVGTQIDIFIPSHSKEKLPAVERENKTLADGGNKSVLLIDDEETVLNVTKDILAELGFDVILTDKPEEAIEIFKDQSSQISLVVTDMMMPRLSGIEVAHKLREIKTDIPILFCSGDTKHLESNEVRDFSNKGCIMKPVEIFQFSAQISELLDRSLRG